MINTSDVEASFHRHLYETLEVPLGIKIFESVNQVSFDKYTKWVVIDTLTNILGAEPKQLFFVHVATQKGMKNEKSELSALVDSVMVILEVGTRINRYDATTGVEVSEMEISDLSLSPILQHPGGGAFRSFTVGLVY